MDHSVQLFTVRGIAIRMHLTFPLILFWAALQFGVLSRAGWEGALFGIVATLLLFVIVVLHELGHSVAAQHYGVEVKQIVLLPLGGVAQLARIPEKPVEELVIAIAGPAVNFGLAMIFGVLAWVLGLNLDPRRLPGLLLNLSHMSALALFGYTFASNLLLGVFNLLPAFPMDGGRILRALLATRMSFPRATVVAVAVGQALAWAMGLAGFLRGDFFWILIAIFVYAGASQERQLVTLRSVLGGLTVAQAYSHKPLHISPQAPLQSAVDLTLNSFQSDFPVCEGDRLVGLLTHSKLVEALNRHGARIPVEQVMIRGIEPVRPDDELITAQQRMAEEKLDALPVSDGEHFLGLITNRDISEIFKLASISSDFMRSDRGGPSHAQPGPLI